jgi:integrase
MTRYRFNDRWLRSCQPPTEGRLDYADQLCPGLHLRITARGAKSFSAMLRVNRRLQRRTIGRYPQITLSQAREATLAMQRLAADGRDVREPRAESQSLLTYVELVERYDELHLTPNTRSGADIRASLLHKSLANLLTRPAAGITKRDLIAVIDSIMATGKTQAAVNILRRLKMLFNWAADRDLIPLNPCERIRPPAKTNERDRVLSDAEISAVWSASFELPAPFGEMYRMFFLTGQRRSEVSTMRWSEVAGDLWTIPREKVKKDRPHTVPLSLTAQRLLAELAERPRLEEDGYVFSTTGGKSPSSSFDKIKRQLESLSATTGWTIHDIRRTKLAELGVPREVARKVLNHEDGKVDRIYNRHEYLTEKRDALARWERSLLSLAREQPNWSA